MAQARLSPGEDFDSRYVNRLRGCRLARLREKHGSRLHSGGLIALRESGVGLKIRNVLLVLRQLGPKGGELLALQGFAAGQFDRQRVLVATITRNS